MLLDNRGQRRGILHVVHPPRQLRVPDERVAPDGEVVLGGVVDEGVGGRPVVRALLRGDLVPLHAVLGRQLAKGRLDDGRVLLVGQQRLVGAGAEVELALLLHQRVEVGDGLAGVELELEEGHGEGAGGHEEGGRLHAGGCILGAADEGGA